MNKFMKMFSLIAVVAMLFVAGPALAWDIDSIGLSGGSSEWNQSTGNVTTGTNSFHGVGVLGSGSVDGANHAGGQAVTTHDNVFVGSVGTLHGGATQNFGQAIGDFSYSIETGDKKFRVWFFEINPMAGAIAGTKGDVSQWSADGSQIDAGPSPSGVTGLAGSCAIQNSAAGFVGIDGAFILGKNLGPVTGSFIGNSVVIGETYSYSYKGIDSGVKYIGTMSGAANSANTDLTGNYGSGYAYGSGATQGYSAISTVNGSTSGMYTGKFSYSGNGYGNVSGYSVSTYQNLTNGGIVGTQTGVSVNIVTP